jgi:hypothetical protein
MSLESAVDLLDDATHSRLDNGVLATVVFGTEKVDALFRERNQHNFLYGRTVVKRDKQTVHYYTSARNVYIGTVYSSSSPPRGMTRTLSFVRIPL